MKHWNKYHVDWNKFHADSLKNWHDCAVLHNLNVLIGESEDFQLYFEF